MGQHVSKKATGKTTSIIVGKDVYFITRDGIVTAQELHHDGSNVSEVWSSWGWVRAHVTCTSTDMVRVMTNDKSVVCALSSFLQLYMSICGKKKLLEQLSLGLSDCSGSTGSGGSDSSDGSGGSDGSDGSGSGVGSDGSDSSVGAAFNEGLRAGTGASFPKNLRKYSCQELYDFVDGLASAQKGYIRGRLEDIQRLQALLQLYCGVRRSLIRKDFKPRGRGLANWQATLFIDAEEAWVNVYHTERVWARHLQVPPADVPEIEYLGKQVAYLVEFLPPPDTAAALISEDAKKYASLRVAIV